METRTSQRSQCCENSPPDDTQCENAPRPEAIGQPPSQHLTSGIADQKRTENPAQPHVVDAQFIADETSCDGNVGSIQECDCAQQKHPQDQNLPNCVTTGRSHPHLAINFSTALRDLSPA